MHSLPRRARTAIGVLALVLVAVVAWQLWKQSKQGDFASDPDPCALVSTQTVRRLVPVEPEPEEKRAMAYCTWAPAKVAGGGPPTVQVQVTRLWLDEAHTSFLRTKAEPEGKAGPMTTDLTDFGDEAFIRYRYIAGSNGAAEVVFRRSNVVVSVRYSPADGDSEKAGAGAVAAAAEAADRLGREK
ncbi:hypothetical protein [Streptomyces sp. NPDC060031]|uniref:hypothetical protein n=1 Tax=Streptomyces sp. NPDC060031 TaxID=3347043 RepID=UPI0036BDA956